MVTEFGNMTYACNKGLDSASLTMLKTMLPGNRFLSMPVVQRGLEAPGADCIADTNAVLHYYGFERSFGNTFGILLGYLTVCHVLTYVAMTFVARKEQRRIVYHLGLCCCFYEMWLSGVQLQEFARQGEVAIPHAL
eukprot:GHRQ01019603.1.p2 GENE.GHRQ01019603.1~~GHRQ01019603.1.p2  ORF type:complete len:152 (+),score=42.53 GHRQ01019603.1:49-456(+)